MGRAARSGKPTIEINPGDTEISDIVDIRVKLGAAEALELIWQEFIISSREA